MSKNNTEILVIRTFYTSMSTSGYLIVDGEKWGVTLEDRIRPAGVKLPGMTCIPEGRYSLAWRHSPKFKRDMLWLQNVEGFQYIYFHGGNTHEHTDGCILAARERSTWDFILGSLEKKLADYVRERGIDYARVTVINGPGHEKFTDVGCGKLA